MCTLRNPVQRVVSLYRLKRAYGVFPWSLEEAMMRDPELLESGKYATHLEAWQTSLGSERVLTTFYEDLQRNPQEFIDQLVDFIGVPRFALTPAQIRHVHASAPMTHPRVYSWTRAASWAADWLKARRLDPVVATVKRSPLVNLFLGGGPAFEELTPETALRLQETFAPEVEKLELLLNRDLSAWKVLYSAPPCVAPEHALAADNCVV